MPGYLLDLALRIKRINQIKLLEKFFAQYKNHFMFLTSSIVILSFILNHVSNLKILNIIFTIYVNFTFAPQNKVQLHYDCRKITQMIPL